MARVYAHGRTGGGHVSRGSRAEGSRGGSRNGHSFTGHTDVTLTADTCPRRTVKWHGQDRANPPEPPVKRHRGEPGHTRGTAQYRAFQYLSRFLYPYPSDIYYRSPIDGTHWLPNKEMTKLWEVSDETRRTIPALSVSDTPV